MGWFLLPVLLIQGYLLRSPWFFIQELWLSLAPYITALNIIVGLFLLVSALFKSDKALYLVYVIAYSLSAYIFFNMLNYTYFEPNYYLSPYRISTQGQHAIPLKIFYANIYHQNPYTQQLLEQIQQENPDIVMLVEYAQLQDNAISSLLQEEYPYVSRLLGVRGYDGDVIFSRSPLETISHDNTSLLFSHIKTRHQSRDVDIILAHTSAPVSQPLFSLRNTQLNELKDILQEYISNELPSNIILAGDLNITPFSSYYQGFENSLLSSGLKNLTRDLSSTSYTTRIPYTRCLHNFSMICAHIDHIWSNRGGNLRILEVVWSDHHGFVGTIKLF